MSKQLKLRKGTTAEHAAFTGALAEITIDTDKKVVVVHDGSTAGGTPLVKDSAVVHKTGDETIAGVKTFSSTIQGSISGSSGSCTGNAATATSAGNADTLDGNHASAFQATLVSGSNIKTVNGTSLLGTGDVNTSLPYNCLQFVASKTYTPDASVKAFYVFVIGSMGHTNTTDLVAIGGVGGPGYSEKYVSSVSGSYTITIGAVGVNGGGGGTTSFVGSGVSISVTGSGGVNSNAPSSGGVATGGYFNANGGAGGYGNTGVYGGGGGSGSRAGVGGIGGNAPTSYINGGGGGTGGNNASGSTPGKAATTEAAGALSLPFLSIINKFEAGSSVVGASCVGYYAKCLATNASSTFPSNYLKGSGAVYIVEVI